jgi:DNA-binding transcriptional regulator GbsR (MarR family)
MALRAAETLPAAPAEEAEGALEAPVLDEPLRAELGSFEQFFKTFGFKRVHGRVWGLLVLADRPLANREIASELSLAHGTTSTTVNELAEWGAISTEFSSERRCHLHSAVGNALSIVATVFRRREQVAFQQFKQTARRALAYIAERHGERDPRCLTLRSIITTCELAEALMGLVLGAVTSALGDPEHLLSKALSKALEIGVGVPTRMLRGGRPGPSGDDNEEYEEEEGG